MLDRIRAAVTSKKPERETPPPPTPARKPLPLVYLARPLTNEAPDRPAQKPPLNLAAVARQPQDFPELAFLAAGSQDGPVSESDITKLLEASGTAWGPDQESLLQSAAAMLPRVASEESRSGLQATLVTKYCDMAGTARTPVHAEAFFRTAIDLDTGLHALSALLARFRSETNLTPEVIKGLAISTVLADPQGTALDPATGQRFIYPDVLHAPRAHVLAEWDREPENNPRGLVVVASIGQIPPIVRIIMEYAGPDRAALVELMRKWLAPAKTAAS